MIAAELEGGDHAAKPERPRRNPPAANLVEANHGALHAWENAVAGMRQRQSTLCRAAKKTTRKRRLHTILAASSGSERTSSSPKCAWCADLGIWNNYAAVAYERRFVG